MTKETDFKTDPNMEQILKVKENQPEMFAQLSPTTKMALGIYLDNKQRAEISKPTAEDIARLRK